MNYQEIETVNIDGTTQKHIILDLGDGAFKSFPIDLENPEYKAWAIAEGLIEPDPEPEIVEETPAPTPIVIEQ